MPKNKENAICSCMTYISFKGTNNKQSMIVKELPQVTCEVYNKLSLHIFVLCQVFNKLSIHAQTNSSKCDF